MKHYKFKKLEKTRMEKHPIIPSNLVIKTNDLSLIDRIIASKKIQGQYHIYKANSKAEAYAFLRTITNIPAYTYHVVETPEGNFGKDNLGIYHEPSSTNLGIGECFIDRE